MKLNIKYQDGKLKTGVKINGKEKRYLSEIKILAKDFYNDINNVLKKRKYQNVDGVLKRGKGIFKGLEIKLTKGK